MSRKRKGKEGLSLGGIIGLIVLFYLLRHFGWLIGLLFAAVIIAILFFVIRAIIQATKENESPKHDPVDVSTQGTYPKQPAKTNSTSTSNSAVRPAPQKKEPVYPPEVQAVVDEGKRAHKELEHLYATIPDLSVKAKIRELINVSDKIIEDAVQDRSDVPQIKKFLDYYLPTTIKLLNAYDRMGAQGIEGNNISGTMQSIEEMLDTAVAAYKKLLDSLFANQALDVETDIEVMNTLLKREGLTGSEFGSVSGFSTGSTATAGTAAGYGKITKEEK